MSYQVHNRAIPPRGVLRKRKERDDGSAPLGFMPPPSAPSAAKPPRWPTTPPPAVSSNRLLAGYMAYEFITKGTLLGQEYSSAAPAEPRRAEPVKERKAAGGSGEGAVQESYAEVASILKTEGAHIPGIVNPTQLARWIQM